MTGAWEPDDDIGAGAPPEVLARARRVGPDLDANADQLPNVEPEREPEPWELPPAPPPPPRLRERSVEDVFERVRELTLPQARAFLRAYEAIPRSELDLGGWAPGSAAVSSGAPETPSIEEIVKSRALLRDGAGREARASGADIDLEATAGKAGEAVVEALSHTSLRGGRIEDATVAAEVAAKDTAVALAARPWISEWRFQELVEPWVNAYSVAAVEAHTFDVLGALALAFGVMALATFGLGRSNVTTGDLPALLFAALAVIVLVIRWRIRRRPMTA